MNIIAVGVPHVTCLSEAPGRFCRHLSRVVSVSTESLRVGESIVDELLRRKLCPCAGECLKDFSGRFSAVNLIKVGRTNLGTY